MEMKTLTLNGHTFDVNDPNAVQTGPQPLTPAEQAQARVNIGAVTAAEVKDVYNITSIDTIYTSIEELPLDVGNGTQYVVAASATDRAIYTFDANTSTWVKKIDLKSNSLYVVLTGNKAGLYRYTMGNDVLLRVEPSVLYTEQKLSPEQQAQARQNIGANSLFVVTLSDDKKTASHTSSQIYERIQKGDIVVLFFGSGDAGVYYSLSQCDSNMASFVSAREDFSTTIFDIYHDATVEWYDNFYASYNVYEDLEELESTVGNIETALDNIIAIQESLIGGAAE